MSASKGDEFKSLDNIYLPDPRENLTKIDLNTFQSVERTIEDHHRGIAEYSLLDSVPEEITTQYEVARNIYLYAWHAYRFYMVAEHQVLVVLEFAVKRAVGKKKIKRFGEKQRKGSGLAACLCYINNKGLIKNEDFESWHRSRQQCAESKFQMDMIREMSEKGIDEFAYDPDEINVEDFPYEHDYMAILQESLPYIRNDHAHGTTTLHRQVLGSFDVVSTIINKLYAETETKPVSTDNQSPEKKLYSHRS